MRRVFFVPRPPATAKRPETDHPGRIPDPRCGAVFTGGRAQSDHPLLSSTKIERLHCPGGPACIVLPGGQKAAPGRGQHHQPAQPATKGPTPRFAPSVGLGRCSGRRRATNALKRATTGDTVRGPLRWRGTALWIALGRMINLLGRRLSEPRRTAAFFQTDVLALLQLNAIAATSFVPLRLAAEFRGEEAYPYPLRLSVSPAVRSQRTPSRWPGARRGYHPVQR